jgi:hypothetical protein
LSHWLRDADLASIRDLERLKALPEAEREACTVLWSDVNSLLEAVKNSKPSGGEPAEVNLTDP